MLTRDASRLPNTAGKNLGAKEDGTPIVRSLVAQFPRKTFVWLVNKCAHAHVFISMSMSMPRL